MNPLLSNRSKAEIVSAILLVVLAILLYKSRMTLSATRQQLVDQVAANSAIIKAQSKRTEDRGKVTITKTYQPGTKLPSQVSTEIEPTRIESERISDIAKGLSATPDTHYHYLLGGSFPPALSPLQHPSIRGGVILSDRLDLTLDYQFYGSAAERFRIGADFRF